MGETINIGTDDGEFPKIAERIQSLVEEEFGSDTTVKIYANGDTLDVQVEPVGIARELEREHDVDVMTYSDFKFTVHRD